jgi:hypothetical protein
MLSKQRLRSTRGRYELALTDASLDRVGFELVQSADEESVDLRLRFELLAQLASGIVLVLGQGRGGELEEVVRMHPPPTLALGEQVVVCLGVEVDVVPVCDPARPSLGG